MLKGLVREYKKHVRKIRIIIIAIWKGREFYGIRE